MTQRNALAKPFCTLADVSATKPPNSPASAEPPTKTARPVGISRPKVIASTIAGRMLGKNSVRSAEPTSQTKRAVMVPAIRPTASPWRAPWAGSDFGSSSGLGIPRAARTPKAADVT